jgi:hypothetical protein
MNRTRFSRAVAAVVTASLLAAPGFSATGLAQAGRPQTVAGTTKAAGLTGTVIGTAWKGDTTPYPQARIRLRNVQTGRPNGLTVADGEGRFHFEGVEPGPYVVELLSEQDKVLAVGDLFAVTIDTEAVTLVRLTSKAPWSGGFFGNAAAAVIAAASTLGVTAVGSNGRPASPQ